MTLTTRDLQSIDRHPPTVPEGDTLIHDEPGRVLVRTKPGGYGADTCYRAYHFRVTQNYNSLTLRVAHGGGEESQHLGYTSDAIAGILQSLDSDARFFVLWELYDTRSTAQRKAREHMQQRIFQAFADGRLRKRINRKRGITKVWIEDNNASK